MSKNYYLTSSVKKLNIPRTKDLEEYTGIPVSKHLLLIGGTGSGKTNALLDFITLSSQGKGVFDTIYLCYKTDEPLYDMLSEKLKKDQFIKYRRVEDVPNVDTFQDLTHYDDDEPIKEILFIFDDCVNEKGKNLEKIKQYFTYGRKKGITLVFLSQSFYGTDIFIRRNVSFICLLQGLKKRDKQMIARDICDLSTEEFEKIYKDATTPEHEDEIPFLKVNSNACPDNKKMSRNWLDYYEEV